MQNPRNFWLTWGIKLLGIALLLVLLHRIDLHALLESLKQFHLKEIVLLEIISLLVILTKALRFKILVGRYSLPVGWGKSTIIYGSGMFFSAITPGRLGDFIKVYYLKNLYGSSLRKGVYLSIVDRLFDLVTIALFALFGLALLIPVKIIIAGLLVGLIIIVAFFLIAQNHITVFITHFIGWIGLRLNLDLKNFRAEQLFSRRLVLPGLFSLIPNGLIFLQMLIIAEISHIYVSPLDLIGTLALGNLISMLPVTISGLGTREATFILLMEKLGVSATQAVSLSLSFFLFNNLGILFISLILFLIFKPQSRVESHA